MQEDTNRVGVEDEVMQCTKRHMLHLNRGGCMNYIFRFTLKNKAVRQESIYWIKFKPSIGVKTKSELFSEIRFFIKKLLTSVLWSTLSHDIGVLIFDPVSSREFRSILECMYTARMH